MTTQPPSDKPVEPSDEVYRDVLAEELKPWPHLYHAFMVYDQIMRSTRDRELRTLRMLIEQLRRVARHDNQGATTSGSSNPSASPEEEGPPSPTDQ